MDRRDIIEALEALLEDLARFRMSLPLNAEIEAFFEPDELLQFSALLREEFGLSDDTLLESAQTFRDLVVLLEDEFFR